MNVSTKGSAYIFSIRKVLKLYLLTIYSRVIICHYKAEDLRDVAYYLSKKS